MKIESQTGRSHLVEVEVEYQGYVFASATIDNDTATLYRRVVPMLISNTGVCGVTFIVLVLWELEFNRQSVVST